MARALLLVSLAWLGFSAQIDINVIPSTLSQFVGSTTFNSGRVYNIALSNQVCLSNAICNTCDDVNLQNWKAVLGETVDASNSASELSSGDYSIQVRDILTCLATYGPQKCAYSSPSVSLAIFEAAPAELPAAELSINILTETCDCANCPGVNVPRPGLNGVRIEADASFATFTFSGAMFAEGTVGLRKGFNIDQSTFLYYPISEIDGNGYFLDFLGSPPLRAVWPSANVLQVEIKPDNKLDTIPVEAKNGPVGALSVGFTVRMNSESIFAHPRNFRNAPISNSNTRVSFDESPNNLPFYAPSTAVTATFTGAADDSAIITQKLGDPSLTPLQYNGLHREETIEVKAACAGTLNLNFTSSSFYSPANLKLKLYKLDMASYNEATMNCQPTLFSSCFNAAFNFLKSKTEESSLSAQLNINYPQSEDVIYAVCNWFPYYQGTPWSVCQFTRVKVSYADQCNAPVTPAPTLNPTVQGAVLPICQRGDPCNGGTCIPYPANPEAFSCCCPPGKSGFVCDEDYVFSPVPPCGQVYVSYTYTFELDTATASLPESTLIALIQNAFAATINNAANNVGTRVIPSTIRVTLTLTRGRRLLATTLTSEAVVPVSSQSAINIQTIDVADTLAQNLPAGFTVTATSQSLLSSPSDPTTAPCQVSWATGCPQDVGTIIAQPGPFCVGTNCACPTLTRPNPGCGGSGISDREAAGFKVAIAVLVVIIVLVIITVIVCYCYNKKQSQKQQQDKQEGVEMQLSAYDVQHEDVGSAPDLGFPQQNSSQAPPLQFNA